MPERTEKSQVSEVLQFAKLLIQTLNKFENIKIPTSEIEEILTLQLILAIWYRKLKITVSLTNLWKPVKSAPETKK